MRLRAHLLVDDLTVVIRHQAVLGEGIVEFVQNCTRVTTIHGLICGHCTVATELLLLLNKI